VVPHFCNARRIKLDEINEEIKRIFKKDWVDTIIGKIYLNYNEYVKYEELKNKEIKDTDLFLEIKDLDDWIIGTLGKRAKIKFDEDKDFSYKFYIDDEQLIANYISGNDAIEIYGNNYDDKVARSKEVYSLPKGIEEAIRNAANKK
jgi:hypothetical protein